MQIEQKAINLLNQPKILNVDELVEVFKQKLYPFLISSDMEKKIFDMVNLCDRNGQFWLYYKGGYKELVELIGKRISLLEEDGRITPLDVEIKKAFENLKKPE